MSAQSTPFPPTSSNEPMRPDSGDGSLQPKAAASSGGKTPTAHDERSSDASEMIERIAQSAHQTIDRLAEVAAPRVNRLQEGLSGAGDSLHMRVDRVRDVSGEWTESLRCTVRDNPLAAIGVALAVGVLIARLSSSRSDLQ